MVTALWALVRCGGLGRQRKIFQLAAIHVVKTEVSEQGPKAGKLLLDDTPIEKTGQQIEGSRVDS